MVTTRPTGLLNIPNLAEPSGSNIDTRARAIKAWLAELPFGDPIECGKRVVHTLGEINRLNISIKHRSAILELLIPKVLEISEGLSQRFATQNLPLNTRNLEAAHLNVLLFSELAVGYKIIIEQTWSHKLSVFNTRSMLSNLYRAMTFLNQVLRSSYEIYQDPPPNTWTHIHQIYLYAENNELAQSEPRDICKTGDLQKTTIDDLYKQVVLLGLLCPYRLRQLDAKKVANALKDWSKLCKILPSEEFSFDSGQVLVKLNCDFAPSYFFSEENINHVYSRILDTQELVKLINDQLAVAASDSRGDVNFYELPVDIIRMLENTWSGKSQRSHARKKMQRKLDLTLGISAIHQMINQLQQENRRLIDRGLFAALVRFKSPGTEPEFVYDNNEMPYHETSTLTLEPAPDLDQNNFSNAGSLNADVWDADYGSKALGFMYNQQHQVEPDSGAIQEKSPLESYKSDNLNESINGHCILSLLDVSSDATKAKVGEIIGIKTQLNDDTTRISIGVVRRMRYLEDKSIEMGVQKLAPIADTVTTCNINQLEGHRKFVRGFIIPADKALKIPCTLLLNTKFKTGDSLILQKLGYQIQVRLTRQIEFTNAFVRYEFNVTKILGALTKQNVQDKNESIPQTSSWTII